MVEVKDLRWWLYVQSIKATIAFFLFISTAHTLFNAIILEKQVLYPFNSRRRGFL